MASERERVIGALVLLIDPDRPPGLAARQLAATIVALVEDREMPEVVTITTRLMRLQRSFPRRAVNR